VLIGRSALTDAGLASRLLVRLLDRSDALTVGLPAPPTSVESKRSAQRLAAVDVSHVTRRSEEIMHTVARNMVAPDQQRTVVVEDAEGEQARSNRDESAACHTYMSSAPLRAVLPAQHSATHGRSFAGGACWHAHVRYREA
jgi:hypothetical protein